ncbi:HAD-IA family hydrolase [Acidobacteria bacterium AH-259-D05]|nr:HAD-IA family hydrolase [Acidobacteria bacterium AH-259-D05]
MEGAARRRLSWDTSWIAQSDLPVKAVVLDFDGVILESLDIKTRAFQELFKQYPEHMDRIVSLHLDNAGISRFEKFKIIYQDYLGQPVDEKELERLGQAFSRLVYEGIFKCPFVRGAYQFLEKYSTRYELFVASGTPEGEIRDIVRERRLDRFFRAVYGSPREKGEILRGILEKNDFQSGQVVFIGDALSDYLGAREVSVPFIGRVSEGKSSPFPNDGVIAVVEDLRQLDRKWDSLVDGLSQ